MLAAVQGLVFVPRAGGYQSREQQLSAEIEAHNRLLLDLFGLWARAYPHRRLRDYGLPEGGTFSPQEADMLRTLLPPGRVVPDLEVFLGAFAHLGWGEIPPFELHRIHNVPRVVGSRMRPKLAALGWQLPPKSVGGWVLLRPGQVAPAGFRSHLTNPNPRRRIPPALARQALDGLHAGVPRDRLVERLHIGQEALGQLRVGTHWTQREGLCPRLSDLMEDTP